MSGSMFSRNDCAATPKIVETGWEKENSTVRM